MDMTDANTLSFYQRNVQDVFARYESVQSPLMPFFPIAFLPGSRVLDVGCGSGRDVKALLKQGYDAHGVEPVAAMREMAIAHSPELSTRIQSGHLPDIPTHDRFDGIICSAVLMHIPTGQQLEAFVNMRNLLNVGGRLLLSVPADRDDLDADFRDAQGRLFIPMEADRVRLLAEQLGLVLISQFSTQDALGRGGISWNILLFEKSAEHNRPLDRIESVLKHDKKVATYKLALLRAFCDMADRDAGAVIWLGSGYIGMPLHALAECWLNYYWPLMAAPLHIPQNTTDHLSSTRPPAFRKALTELITMAEANYGTERTAAYSLFMLGWKKNNLPVALTKQLHKTLSILCRTLIDGPIQHSAQGDMFCYDKNRKLVLLEVDLWREFCLSGYWIRDSLFLRWAELCERFAQRIDPDMNRGVVLPYLIQREDPKREQNLARLLYAESPQLTCVWSDRSISINTMDIDHVLPFSLWHNNDLWNLLPAASTVNRSKSDKVPTPEFLRRRQDAIITNWRFANQIEATVFQHELQRTLGRFRVERWELDLFQHLSERAAQAIYQRGEKPWEWT